jgi:hypothetical protein
VLVPVTVYVVAEAGVTVIVEPLILPGIQRYVFAPLPVRTLDPPLQMEVILALAFTGGVGFTVMVRVAVFEHRVPASTPVTVYVVVTSGDSVKILPLKVPGCQL